jgi:hypothetical protein
MVNWKASKSKKENKERKKKKKRDKYTNKDKTRQLFEFYKK